MEQEDINNITTYQAGAALAALHRLMQKYCDSILRPFGISKMQWLIIGYVLDAGTPGARISDLAHALGTTIPYLTNTINTLELKGYLIRTENTNDSRSKLVMINPEYIKICNEIEDMLRRTLRNSIYIEIDPEEFRIYMRVLYRLIAVADQNLQTVVEE